MRATNLFAFGTLASASVLNTRSSLRTRNTSSITGAKLRILPLGASITYGYHSTSGNGYRLDLENLLRPFADVTYIGSQCSGNMTNGNNEGHPGYLINQMEAVVQPDLPQMPNLMLLYVGTNDMVYPYDPTTAPQRMGTLVETLHKACPEATIIVGNLFEDLDPAVQARIETFNQNLPPVIEDLQQQGIKTLIADLSNALNSNDLFCDGEHPIDRGYQKMADVLFGSIIEAAALGYIEPPVNSNVTSTVNCTPTPATGAGTCSPTTTTTSGNSTMTKAVAITSALSRGKLTQPTLSTSRQS